MQQILKRTHLVTRRNMGCFQGLAILIVVCTVIICALQILCFFLSKKTRNVSSSRINEDLNGHNREPGKTREINIQWPHLNRRKQPIEHSEQLFNQVGFMTITYCEQLLRQLLSDYTFFISSLRPNLHARGLFRKYGDNEWCYFLFKYHEEANLKTKSVRQLI